MLLLVAWLAVIEQRWWIIFRHVKEGLPYLRMACPKDKWPLQNWNHPQAMQGKWTGGQVLGDTCSGQVLRDSELLFYFVS